MSHRASHAAPRVSLAARAAEGARGTRGALILLGALTVLYIATATYGDVSTDIRATFLPAWELGQNHTINSDGYIDVSQFLHVVDGHVRSDRFPGAILLAVPGYFLLGLVGGVDHPVLGPSAATAALMAAGSVVLMHRALLRITTSGVALAGALVLALGTPTWTVTSDALWTHTSTQLGICLALFGIATNRWLYPFLGMALAASARPHAAVIAFILGVGLVLRAKPLFERSRMVLAAALGFGTLAGWGVILIWTRVTFGYATLLPGSYQGRGNNVAKTDVIAAGNATPPPSKLDGWPENILGFLFSPERGVFVLTPILLLCLFGVWKAWRSAPGWAKDAAIASVAYSIVQLAGNYFAGGTWFYSYRLAIEAVTLAVPLALLAAVAMFDRVWWSRLAVLAVGYGFVVHSLGAIFYRSIPERFHPWTTYHPWLLTRDVPLRLPAALLIGTALTLWVVALIRSDPGRRAHRVDSTPAVAAPAPSLASAVAARPVDIPVPVATPAPAPIPIPEPVLLPEQAQAPVNGSPDEAHPTPGGVSVYSRGRRISH